MLFILGHFQLCVIFVCDGSGYGQAQAVPAFLYVPVAGSIPPIESLKQIFQVFRFHIT